MTAILAVGPSAVLGHSLESEIKMKICLLGVLMACQLLLAAGYLWIGVRCLRAQARERMTEKECRQITTQSPTPPTHNTNADKPAEGRQHTKQIQPREAVRSTSIRPKI